jgi:hypothetical protein
MANNRLQSHRNPGHDSSVKVNGLELSLASAGVDLLLRGVLSS